MRFISRDATGGKGIKMDEVLEMAFELLCPPLALTSRPFWWGRVDYIINAFCFSAIQLWLSDGR